MAEGRWTGCLDLVNNLFHLMASAAIMGVKGLFAVMTGTAGLATVHFHHRVVTFAFTSSVAGGTTERRYAPSTLLFQVFTVAEYYRAGIFCCKRNIF